MYELIILSLLMQFSLHGYLIAKIANDKIGPWAKISNGTLYPLLTKLEQAGLIASVNHENVAKQGERHTRTFSITEEGRKRFHQLMMDTSSNLGDYPKIFRYKVTYLDLVELRDRMHLLNHYINYCQTYILYLKSEEEDLEHDFVGYQISPFFKETVLDSMRHQMRQWQNDVDWTMQLRERILQQGNVEESNGMQANS